MPATATTPDADAPAVDAPARPAPDVRPSARAGTVRIPDLAGPPMPPDRAAGWLWTLVITAMAGVLRFWHLSSPGGKIFDEVYYAKDSTDVWHRGVEVNGTLNGAGYVVHPPVGKWMLAFGQWLYGHNELGWRFSAALTGTLAVLVVVRVGRRLFRSTLLGCTAGLLVALDGLQLVHSRTGLLDIFLHFWLLVSLACLLADRDVTRARLARAVATRPVDSWLARGPRIGVRWWRLAGGVAFGLAMGVKWAAVWYLPLYLGATLWWDWRALRMIGVARPARAMLGRLAPAAVAGWLVLPLAAYTASWTGWFLGGRWAYKHDLYVVAGQGPLAHAVAVVRGWLSYHAQVLHFHTTLVSPHPYQSHPAGWLLLVRPVLFFAQYPKVGEQGCTDPNGCVRDIVDLGTPAIWWAALAALVVVAWLWVSRRDWRAGFILLGTASTILPWLPSDAAHRTMFYFYALPAVPYLALAITMAIGWALGPVPPSLPPSLTVRVVSRHAVRDDTGVTLERAAAAGGHVPARPDAPTDTEAATDADAPTDTEAPAPDPVVAAAWRRRQLGATGAGAYLLLVIANAWYFWPIWTAQVLGSGAFDARMWFRSWR